MQRLIAPRRRRTRFMAKPKRRRGSALRRATLAGLVMLVIAAGGSVTASMLAAPPAERAIPDDPRLAAVDPIVPRPVEPTSGVSIASHPRPAPDAVATPMPGLPADRPTEVEEPPIPNGSGEDQTQLGPDLDRPTAPPSPGPLPACAKGDELAPHRGLDEWQITFLDRMYGLPARYEPERLVSVRQAGFDVNARVRPEVIADLSQMRRAARAAGAPIAVVSGYRSYRNQSVVFSMWRDHLGRRATTASARPGHSEHQLGTSLDFRTARSYGDPWDHRDWSRTLAGRWLAQNSWRYGFVLSYPRGRESATCYGYEPWHFRYVGRPVATAVHESGLTLREYLWEHHGPLP